MDGCNKSSSTIAQGLGDCGLGDLRSPHAQAPNARGHLEYHRAHQRWRVIVIEEIGHYKVNSPYGGAAEQKNKDKKVIYNIQRYRNTHRAWRRNTNTTF